MHEGADAAYVEVEKRQCRLKYNIYSRLQVTSNPGQTYKFMLICKNKMMNWTSVEDK